ncbi:hypothetical protein AX15_001283 [Amanita polypyramis BW_CC]|nr:hypothetical protein AX15_001283 [Amanita polypyramis BW_CC]
MANTRDVSSIFVTLGMFIIDEFLFMDEEGNITEKKLDPQESGSRLHRPLVSYLSFLDWWRGYICGNRRSYMVHYNTNNGDLIVLIASRLTPDNLGMVVDRGRDFPPNIHSALMQYGEQMWLFRTRDDTLTTRALNSYYGERRGFQYLTPKIRITPRDLLQTRLARPKALHFICSPTRASTIISEIHEIGRWSPLTIYEPIPDSCIPSQLPALIRVLPDISILSPNAEEALSLLSIPLPPLKQTIEAAADRLLTYNIGGGSGWVIIRSGAMGAYAKSREVDGRWIDGFWTPQDGSRVVDVTGAGNSFLGGLAAGLLLTGNVVEATLYASVSASFVIEQEGLPLLSSGNIWNNDSPQRRLELLRRRM